MGAGSGDKTQTLKLLASLRPERARTVSAVAAMLSEAVNACQRGAGLGLTATGTMRPCGDGVCLGRVRAVGAGSAGRYGPHHSLGSVFPTPSTRVGRRGEGDDRGTKDLGDRGNEMNPYSYQHEKMGEAIHYLMLPYVPFEKKLVAGMMEFEHAFHMSLPSDSGFNHFDTVAQIMGRSGPWEERAATLTPLQRSQVVKALWELDRAVSRDYYTYEAQR